MARRDERRYREYSTEEQRSQPGCIGVQGGEATSIKVPTSPTRRPTVPNTQCSVLIAPRDLLEHLRRRLPPGEEILAFSDSEPLRALEAITERRPALIALDRLFAASPRGIALVNRIKADPLLGDVRIVVLADDNSPSRTVQRRDESRAVKPPEDQRGTRRARRVRMKSGVGALVDGNPTSLIDLSVLGAQVICRTPLRPNTRVRVTLDDEQDPLRLRGVVVWSRFEISSGTGEPSYRAGIEFAEAKQEKLEGLCRMWVE
jgi:CheY-like chemotaxis protein